MTSMLEMKQKLKDFFGRYESYLIPVLKFCLALAYFEWISITLDCSRILGSIFVVLILALLCAILPMNTIMLAGFVLIIGQCYAMDPSVALFAVVLVILLLILFLRFSPGANLSLLMTPFGFLARIPMAVPIGSGLLGNPLAAAPAASGVLLYYFVMFVKEQEALLRNPETEIPEKLKMLLDGMVKNQEMWVCVLAFLVVVLLVYLLRTRSMDYAWRIANIVGAVTYAFILFAGGLFLEVELSVPVLIGGTVASVVAGVILEFFAFGGDYSRAERLEFEDDDYFYYVKAVPKASISTSSRKIKKINGRQQEGSVPAAGAGPAQPGVPVQQEDAQIQVDFEKKLEESLKDL